MGCRKKGFLICKLTRLDEQNFNRMFWANTRGGQLIRKGVDERVSLCFYRSPQTLCARKHANAISPFIYLHQIGYDRNIA
jgi:hypothetical protein